MKAISTTPFCLLLLVGLVVGADVACAQDTEPSPSPIAISLQLGAPLSSPTGAIRRFIEANALGGSSSSSGTVYPVTKTLPSLALYAEFFWSHSSLGGKLSQAQGRVEGSNNALMRWQVVSFAPLYSYYSRQRTTRISVGPSIQWLQTEAGTDPFPGLFGTPAKLIKTTGVVPGLVVEAGLRFPARKTFFIELSGQYEAAFGQLHNELRLPFVGAGRVVPYDLGFSRFLFNIGFGLRLGTHKLQRSTPGQP